MIECTIEETCDARPFPKSIVLQYHAALGSVTALAICLCCSKAGSLSEPKQHRVHDPEDSTCFIHTSDAADDEDIVLVEPSTKAL